MTAVFVDAVRRGAQEGAAGAAARVQVVTNGVPGATVALPALRTMGPGEVTGLDPGQVVRRFPRPGETSVEPTVLAAVELAEPALPWLFSPPGTPVQPWLMLLVVRDRPGRLETRSEGRLPLLRPGSSSGVDPRDAARWAHVQAEVGPGTTLEDVLGAGTGGARARLLAPVTLDPDTDYLAALVPVFESGRQAGVADRAVADPVDPRQTWQDGTPLPVYDAWRFRTGPPGDFRALAGRLRWRPRPPAGAGRRRLAVDPVAARLWPPGTPDLPPSRVVEVPTAIGAEVARPVPSGDDPVGDRLRTLVDGAGAEVGGGEVVRPPIYGAGPTGVDDVPASPPWLAQLNLDPGARAAAGAGAGMVRRDQEALVEEAWRQLDAVRRANDRVRWSRLAHVVGSTLHERLRDLPAQLATRVAVPSLDRLRVGDGDVRQAAPDGLGVFAPGFGAAGRAAARCAVPAGAATTTGLDVLEALRPGAATAGPDIGVEPSLVDTDTDTDTDADTGGSPATPLLDALEPTTTYGRMLTWAHTVEDGVDPWRELRASPVFTDPVVERLRRLDPEWVLGHAAALEADRVCRLDANGRFVEAFLAGANHELVRELQWRGFPVDDRATPFRRFWPHPQGGDDVPPIEEWTGDLGGNTLGGRELQVFVVKGALLRRYPETVVTAERRPATGPAPSRPQLFRGFLEPDLTYVGLELTDDEIDQGGWHLSLKQPLEAPRFGVAGDDPAPLTEVAGTGGAAVARGLLLRPFHVLVPLS